MVLNSYANADSMREVQRLMRHDETVVRYLTNFLGFPPERLSANGYGEYQPVNPADTPEARAQNRRIELKLTTR